MIVILRQTKGMSWQGLAPNAPDELPKAIWAGNPSKVKASFTRAYKGTELQFINLAEGWDEI